MKKPEFFKAGKIDFPNSTVSRSSRKYVKSLRTLAQIIPPTNSHNKLFLDLIERLLHFDPDQRLTVDKALEHPYLRVQTPDPFPNVRSSSSPLSRLSKRCSPADVRRRK